MRRGCCVRRLTGLSRAQVSVAIDLAMHFLVIRPQRCSFLPYNYSVVCLSVCLTKTDEPIKVSFGLCTRVGPTNRVLGGGADSPWGSGNSGVGYCSPIEMRQTVWALSSKRRGSAGLQTCTQGTDSAICRFRIDSPTSAAFRQNCWPLAVVVVVVVVCKGGPCRAGAPVSPAVGPGGRTSAAKTRPEELGILMYVTLITQRTSVKVV